MVCVANESAEIFDWNPATYSESLNRYGSASISTSRSISLLPRGLKIGTLQSSLPVEISIPDNRPLANPIRATPSISTGADKPRTLNPGTERRTRQRISPEPLSTPITWPSPERRITTPAATTGRARISAPIFSRHRCSPLPFSSATTSPSRVATMTRPSPTPTPAERDSLRSRSHSIRPVWTSRAATRPPGSAANTLSESTKGVSRKLWFEYPAPKSTRQSLSTSTVGVIRGTSATGPPSRIK